jgi:hypothetical protein
LTPGGLESVGPGKRSTANSKPSVHGGLAALVLVVQFAFEPCVH